MARPKIPRKSTAIDMTAMCDVAFLLLSFFILTAKFKPAEAIQVTTPSSVAAKSAPDKDIALITMDKDGKVFLSMDNEQKKGFIADELNNTKSLGIDKQAFVKANFIGSSFSQLASFLKIPEDSRKGNVLVGIPTQDSAHNELTEWIRIIVAAYQGQKLNILLKGDNFAKYPSFKGVVTALKKNDQLKFQMITNPQAVPIGSELWKDKTNNGAK